LGAEPAEGHTSSAVRFDMQLVLAYGLTEAEVLCRAVPHLGMLHSSRWVEMRITDAGGRLTPLVMVDHLPGAQNT
jgi:hypothetical protein